MDITTFQQGGLPSNPADLKAGLQQAQQTAPSGTSGAQYLKMNQFGSPQEGQLTYGMDAVEVQENSRWAVNWKSLKHGFILRDGATVNGEAYASVFKPLPGEDQLRETKRGESWRQSYQGELVCVSGEDVGVVVEYGGDAGGVVKFYKMLMGALEGQLDVDPDSLYALVTWTVTSYYSKKQKKDIYEAAGKIVDWMSQEALDELAADVNGTDAPATETEPESKAETEPEAKAETEPEAKKEPEQQQSTRPANRRRRRAAS